MALQYDYLVFIIVGVPTWAIVDGTWSLLSQLAEKLPEGYNISAYLMMSLTLGNIVPLLAGYLLESTPRSVLRKLVMAILSVGLLTGILLSICWSYTVTIGGVQFSLALYILFFVIGACSSTSNVTHFMFVSSFEASCTTALAAGMGAGSMISGVLAIIQGFLLVGVGYSPSLYFATLALLYLPALYAMAKHTKTEPSTRSEQAEIVTNDRESLMKDEPVGTFSTLSFIRGSKSLLAMHLISCALGYGVVPAIISYACGRFEGRDWILLLATGLNAIITPWPRFLTDYYRLRTVEGLWKGAMGLVSLTVGLLLCACLPNGLSLYNGAGGTLPIILYVSFGSLFGYTNTCVYRYLKDNISSQQVHQAYRCFGVASQTGALIGSLAAFLYVLSSSV